ncbi:MAG: metallophosphoesterase [Bacillota bacterium]
MLWSVLALAVLVLAYAHWVEPEWLRCPEVAVAVPGLPRQFAGVRILHVSDLHGRTHSRWGRSLVELAARLEPDLVAVTGDLAGAKDPAGPVVELLVCMARRWPVFLVPGNHDRARGDGGRTLLSALEAGGVTVLVNSWARWEQQGNALTVAGVDDPATGRDRVATAMRPGPVILLSHAPGVIPKLGPQRPGLVLCGHTHGGQVCVPWVGPVYTGLGSLGRKWAGGVHYLPGMTVAVSRGMGTSLLPLRFSCRPELPVYVLCREES